MKKIFVLIFLLSIISTLSLVGLKSFGSKNDIAVGKAVIIISTLGGAIKEEVPTDGKTVLEIISRNHSIKIFPSIMSKSIQCIDNVCAKNDFWWKFLVNGNKVLDQVDKYKPKKGDIITIEYGDVK
jgi:hypothetical protein